MGNALLIIGLIFIAVLLMFVFCALKAGSDADDLSEQFLNEYREVKENEKEFQNK